MSMYDTDSPATPTELQRLDALGRMSGAHSIKEQRA